MTPEQRAAYLKALRESDCGAFFAVVIRIKHQARVEAQHLATGPGSRKKASEFERASDRLNAMADTLAMLWDLTRSDVWELVEEANAGVDYAVQQRQVWNKSYRLGGRREDYV